MKTLFYVPAIHTSADLGSVAKDVAKRGVADFGREFWEEHNKTVNGFWSAVANYFISIDVSGMKIYQDGMVADGEAAEKIVTEGVKSGSRNYQLVLKLLEQGAVLVRTEDFKLVKEEYDRLTAVTKARSRREKIKAFIRYKLVKRKLLNKRDDFVAKRIMETLAHGEKGIIFIGAYHNVKKRLTKDFLVKEVKNIDKIREYQKLMPFYKKERNKKRFEELSRYLIAKVDL